jgi:hypothetical protein
MIREAIELHVTGMREDGLPAPEASSGCPNPTRRPERRAASQEFCLHEKMA